MLGHTFYHQHLRKYVIVFGTLFNDLNVERKNSGGAVVERIKVPLGYGPKQKWILATQESTTDRRVVATRVPRMGFSLTGLSYDPARKLNTLGRNVAANTSTTSSLMSQYNPVPYNFTFDLFILVNNAEDGTQILEQILPYFTPQFTVTVNTIPDMGIDCDQQFARYANQFQPRIREIWEQILANNSPNFGADSGQEFARYRSRFWPTICRYENRFWPRIRQVWEQILANDSPDMIADTGQ